MIPVTTTLLQRQNKSIDAFRQRFFHEFGVNTEVIVFPPDIAHLMGMKHDPKLNVLEAVLNEHIPAYLKETYKSIFTKSRKRELVELRMIFCLLAREKGFTTTHIGKLCNRDHSTVIYATDTAHDLLQTDAHFKELYKTIKQNLKDIYNQKEYARANQSPIETQGNSQPDCFAALHTGVNQAGQLTTLHDGRSIDLSEAGTTECREQATAQSTVVTL